MYAIRSYYAPRPENPGSATPDAKQRPHIFTHYFVGANSGLPQMFSDQEKSDMAVARLRHAAEISLEMEKEHTVRVVVSNTGAGVITSYSIHYTKLYE